MIAIVYTIAAIGNTIDAILYAMATNGNTIPAVGNTMVAILYTIALVGNTIAVILNTMATNGNTIAAIGNTMVVILDTFASVGNTIRSIVYRMATKGYTIAAVDNTMGEFVYTMASVGNRISGIRYGRGKPEHLFSNQLMDGRDGLMNEARRVHGNEERGRRNDRTPGWAQLDLTNPSPLLHSPCFHFPQQEHLKRPTEGINVVRPTSIVTCAIRQ